MKNKSDVSPSEALEVEEGSGNVFRDLVKRPDEALMKAKLAIVIGTLIRDLHWTQSTVAAKLGIDQPKVSLILRGRLREFSVERLFRFVAPLNRTSPLPSARFAKRQEWCISVELAA